MLGGLADLAADVLGHDPASLRSSCVRASFITLGGTSLRGAEFVARAERTLGLTLPLAALLGPAPLAAALGTATPYEAPPPPAATGPDLPPLPGQAAMLLAQDLHGGTSYHLLFSAELTGEVDLGALERTLEVLTDRHETLRTVFVPGPDGQPRRRVLPHWTPRLHHERDAPAGPDPVRQVTARLGASTAALLDPWREPPVAFVRTGLPGSQLLSIAVHHVLVDGAGIGLLLRELALVYTRLAAGEPPALPPAASPEAALGTGPVPANPATADLAARRVRQLAGAPHTLTLPTDLPPPGADYRGVRRLFTLPAGLAPAVDELARAAGVTRTAVLLAAWALVAARHCGVDDLLIGVPVAGRSGADLADVVALCTRVVPVRCAIDDGATVTAYVQAVSVALADGLAAAQVQPETLVSALGAAGDRRRNPLVQVAFAAHDDLIPARLPAGRAELTVHEGHCGGAIFDAILYVQSWADGPRLALEHRTAALLPWEAAGLAESFTAALAGFAAAPGGPLGGVRALSAPQRDQLRAWGDGEAVRPGPGVWDLVEAAAARTPEALAVADGPVRLGYRTLAGAVAAQSAELARHGVTRGDVVAVALPRGAAEIVTVLAVLRLGAAYLAVDPADPDDRLRQILRIAPPRAVVGEPGPSRRIAGLAGPACARVDPVDPASPPPADPVPAATGEIAYIAFTSGSTGIPKGVRIPVGAVVRLVDGPSYLRHGPGERMLRLAPLAFDASTLEIFAPLVSGGAVQVCPPGPVNPSELARHLADTGVTVLWLTAGLFRLVADHAPQAFAGVRQVLTGGDVVPAEQVRALLRAHPRLRITNGYGPTENTTFTSVHHLDSAWSVEESVPIGRPVPGTGVVLLDALGGLVPPGGIGELHASGAGLAVDYAADPQATAAAFGRTDPGTGERLYRTGDLARWDGLGRLRFLGRRDGQVKVRGFRVETEEVRRVLLGCPGVRDAHVAAVGAVHTDRRLLGAVAGDGVDLAVLRERCAAALPAHAVPQLWAVLPDLPVTANGKVDTARLAALASPAGLPSAMGGSSSGLPPGATAALPQGVTAALPPGATGALPPGVTAALPPGVTGGARPGAAAGDGVEAAIRAAWETVLGTDRFGPDDRFFDVGGGSLHLAKVHHLLRTAVAGYDLPLAELFDHPTVRALARRLSTPGRS